MSYSQQTVTAFAGGFISGARRALRGCGASSSETLEGSGGQPAPHGAMRRPTGEQCFRSKPELAAPGQPAGPS
jgi:hypothetical protein